jgi:hypothetical protein
VDEQTGDKALTVGIGAFAAMKFVAQMKTGWMHCARL